MVKMQLGGGWGVEGGGGGGGDASDARIVDTLVSPSWRERLL